MDKTSLVYGLVVSHDGPRFWVEVDGTEIPCVMRGRIRKEQGRVSSAVVVGDVVGIRYLPEGSGVIEAVRPRRSELVRPGFKGLPHVIAANLDQLVIVQAAREPVFKPRLVERFLATARRGRMDALVVINKCDLVEERAVRDWIAPLAQNGPRVFPTSATEGRGIEELRAAVAGKVSAFAGQSGVGKSSLLNALYPRFQARVSDVSEWTSKGRHTTTASRLYALPGGGYLADTPGIRELALFDDDEEAITGTFPEIEAAAANGCRFRDCSHSHEPGCAVKRAVERGEIDGERYDSFLRLVQGR